MTGTTSYASLAELKQHCTIPDALDDPRITDVGLSASKLLNDWCRRPFDKDTSVSDRFYLAPRPWDLTLVRSIFVHDFWDAVSLVVKTDDNDDGVYETTWAASDFQLEPSGGFHAGILGWPYSELVTTFNKAWPVDFPFIGQPNSRRYLRAVAVTAKWGWANVPDAIHRATLTLASRLFAEPTAAFGIDVTGIYIGRERMSQVVDMVHPYRNYSDAVGFG